MEKLTKVSDNMLSDAYSRPNLLINGDFSVWQRGIDFTTYVGYTSDRWYVYQNGPLALRYYRALAVFPNSRYAYAIDGVADNISGGFLQRIESYLCQPLIAGTQVTLSFDYWCTQSSVGKAISVGISRANGFDDWSAEHDAVSTTIISPTPFIRHEVTLTIPNEYFVMGTQVILNAIDGVNAGETVVFGNIKLEIGSNATPSSQILLKLT